MYILRSRREEYAKKFEEVTKQEIKNYNDSLLETHMALEGFRKSLKDSIDQYAQQTASLSSTIKKVESENVDLKKTVAVLSKRVEDQRNDLNNLEKKEIFTDSKFFHRIKILESEKEKTKESFKKIEDQYYIESGVLKKSIGDVYSEIYRSSLNSSNETMNLKKEILSRLPSEAEGVKEELLKKLESSSIDNAGITRELEKIKKKAFIQEKMNEYFQTQIDRLKEI